MNERDTWTTARFPVRVESAATAGDPDHLGRHTSCFQNLSGSFCAVGEGQGYDLVESGELDLREVAISFPGTQA